MYYNRRPKRRFISFRVDDAFARRLSREVEGRSDTRSEFIRQAIKRALKENPR
jgi:predicted transcriptional regulator